MSKKFIVALVAVLVIAIGGYAYPKLNFGGSSSQDHYNSETFWSGFSKGNYYATSTSGTATTLRQSDLVNYDFISVTPNTSALTYTFSASSSMPNLVPKAGMIQETCFYNATGTAAATITFVAATGIDLEVNATSTGTMQAPRTLAAGEFGCFKFIRKPATASAFDIGAIYTQYVNAD